MEIVEQQLNHPSNGKLISLNARRQWFRNREGRVSLGSLRPEGYLRHRGRRADAGFLRGLSSARAACPPRPSHVKTKQRAGPEPDSRAHRA
jgi:hypothetical protein